MLAGGTATSGRAIMISSSLVLVKRMLAVNWNISATA